MFTACKNGPFLVHAGVARQLERMPVMCPGYQCTLHDHAATTHAAAGKAALELQRAEAMPHGADAPIAHTAARCTLLRAAAAAAESSSQLASVAETRLRAALLAAQWLLAHAHG